MRNDVIFFRQALKFVTIMLLGQDGPQRLKQLTVFAWYLMLTMSMFISVGVTKVTITNAILTLLTILTFIWVSFTADSRVRKFNLMMDLQNPKHLINSVVKKLERKDFESLERDAFDLNLHCYECLIVKSQHMHHCKRCNACIEYRHKHSSFIGKCIGH